MLFHGEKINAIVLPEVARKTLLDHCFRKLSGEYFEGEESEKKAYGLIGGRIIEGFLYMCHIAPLTHNSRSVGLEKKRMDGLLNQHAEASETPLARRGWVAEPLETLQINQSLLEKELELVAAYHMHRVPWDNDPCRELPTHLDTVLAADSGLFTVIISTVNPEKPIIRAFYEGFPDKEIPMMFHPLEGV